MGAWARRARQTLRRFLGDLHSLCRFGVMVAVSLPPIWWFYGRRAMATDAQIDAWVEWVCAPSERRQ